MPKRFTNKRRKEAKALLFSRDGRLCVDCLKPFGKSYRLQDTIDHVDNNKDNNDPENWILLHRKCNTGEDNRRRAGNPRNVTPENVQEKRSRALAKWLSLNAGKAESPTQTARVTLIKKTNGAGKKTWADGRAFGTSTEIANGILEPPCRLWFFHHVQAHEHITLEEAKYGGAEYLTRTRGRGSPQVVEGYFRKVIAFNGWLEKFRHESAGPAWRFKEGIDRASLEKELREQADEPAAEAA